MNNIKLKSLYRYGEELVPIPGKTKRKILYLNLIYFHLSGKKVGVGGEERTDTLQ